VLCGHGMDRAVEALGVLWVNPRDDFPRWARCWFVLTGLWRARVKLLARQRRPQTEPAPGGWVGKVGAGMSGRTSCQLGYDATNEGRVKQAAGPGHQTSSSTVWLWAWLLWAWLLGRLACHLPLATPTVSPHRLPHRNQCHLEYSHHCRGHCAPCFLHRWQESPPMVLPLPSTPAAGRAWRGGSRQTRQDTRISGSEML